jgi:hypothetical protein
MSCFPHDTSSIAHLPQNTKIACSLSSLIFSFVNQLRQLGRLCRLWRSCAWLFEMTFNPIIGRGRDNDVFAQNETHEFYGVIDSLRGGPVRAIVSNANHKARQSNVKIM